MQQPFLVAEPLDVETSGATGTCMAGVGLTSASGSSSGDAPSRPSFAWPMMSQQGSGRRGAVVALACAAREAFGVGLLQELCDLLASVAARPTDADEQVAVTVPLRSGPSCLSARVPADSGRGGYG